MSHNHIPIDIIVLIMKRENEIMIITILIVFRVISYFLKMEMIYLHVKVYHMIRKMSSLYV